MRFYTNFYIKNGEIYVRGYDTSKKIERFFEKAKHIPCYFHTCEESDWVEGEPQWRAVGGYAVKEYAQENIKAARRYIKENEYDRRIYGSDAYDYVYIHQNFGNEWDISRIRTGYLDIEVASDDGFPEPTVHDKVVTAISIDFRGTCYSFAYKDYSPPKDNKVVHTTCKDEKELFIKFLDRWETLDLDIISGWNVKFFDIPYLYNRMGKIIGEKERARLSPSGSFKERNIKRFNRDHLAVEILGMATLDYLELYKKFVLVKRESYRLDYIANYHLGERKLDYSEVETLHQLYKTDHDKFMDYNVQDARLVSRLEDSMHLIEQALTIAYDAKVKYDDVMAQVRLWDVIIHNYLYDKHIIVPPKKPGHKDYQYTGAYVKEPQTGQHNWVMSYDLTSLYPSLIIQHNISPETLISGAYLDDGELVTEPRDLDFDFTEMVAGNYRNNTKHALTANAYLYYKGVKGFLPEIIETMFNERKDYKNRMLAAERELIEVEKQIEKMENPK